MNRREALRAAWKIGRSLGADETNETSLFDARQQGQYEDVVEGLWSTCLQYDDGWADILIPGQREDATDEPAWGDNGPLSVGEAREAWERGLHNMPIDDDR